MKTLIIILVICFSMPFISFARIGLSNQLSTNQQQGDSLKLDHPKSLLEEKSEAEGLFPSIVVSENECVVPLTPELLSEYDIKSEDLSFPANANTDLEENNISKSQATEYFKVCSDEITHQVLSNLILPGQELQVAWVGSVITGIIGGIIGSIGAVYMMCKDVGLNKKEDEKNYRNLTEEELRKKVSQLVVCERLLLYQFFINRDF